jgi:hypothetical protein
MGVHATGQTSKWPEKETNTASIETEEFTESKYYDANVGGQFPTI